MQYTGNLGLKKPEGTDVVNIDDLNQNFDILDVEVTKLATASQAGRMSAADKVKLDGIGNKTSLLTNNKNTIVEAINELFTSVSNGKQLLETAITDKGGTVSKQGSIATFDELDNGIRSIPVGDYSIGDAISESKLSLAPELMGAEIWSKTDVSAGRGIAVDNAGNVYVTHYVVSKAVRKLDPNGTEIWSKTDVTYGVGIVVDNAGNVYVTHYVVSKAVRKLDPNGTEIWSKADVSYGQGIAVDSAGNVYVTHDVGSGSKAVRKLDPNGNEIWSNTSIGLARDIAVDSNRNVYVAHYVPSGGKAVRKLDDNKYYRIVG